MNKREEGVRGADMSKVSLGRLKLVRVGRVVWGYVSRHKRRREREGRQHMLSPMGVPQCAAARAMPPQIR